MSNSKQKICKNRIKAVKVSTLSWMFPQHMVDFKQMVKVANRHFMMSVHSKASKEVSFYGEQIWNWILKMTCWVDSQSWVLRKCSKDKCSVLEKTKKWFQYSHWTIKKKENEAEH